MEAARRVGFDYEAKAFGTGTARMSPIYIPALKLKYACQALASVSGRVLDIACGGGGMAEALRFYRPDLEIWGCDLSSNSLSIAHRMREGVRFCCGDVFRLPFVDGSFGAVVMFDFLEHLQDPERALQEVHRVLAPSGVFHTAVPFEGEPRTLHGILWRLGWKAKVIHCGHVQMYEFGTPERYIQDAGFRITDRKWTAHLVYQLADVAYFSWLYARGNGVRYSIEGFLEVEEPGARRSLVFAAKALISSLSYMESSLFHWLPAGFGHFTCVDGQDED